jgi:transposase
MRFDAAERRTHDYRRHGTTTLFAALEVATGKITADACYDRHRNGEFLAFLKQVAKAHPRVKLHVVADNYATHNHPNVKAWLAKNPRITMHFTPTSASWMNMVEIFFGHHHPPGDPPRHLHLGPRPDRRDPHVPRRLQPALRTIALDQDRRPDPHQSEPSKELRHATRGVGPWLSRRQVPHTLGLTFLLLWNTFSGSYFALISASRW